MAEKKNPVRRSALVEVKVVKVAPYLRPEKPILWLCEKEPAMPRLLPIAIGEFEAAAIQMQLGRDEPLRPISYDLFASMLDHLAMPVLRAVIHSFHAMAFRANLVVEKEGQPREIDARASDAVALALRAQAPIYVSGELLGEAGISTNPEKGAVEQTIARFYELDLQIVAQDGSHQPTLSGDGVKVTIAETADADISAVTERVAGTAQIVEKPPDPVSGKKDTLSQLQDLLERAVICEEYEEAAHLRDQIERLVKETRT
jgi:bifunctional DNase/RNase